MERKITAKRALAFLLALEMLCTPLAMARVQDPERAIQEIPVGEEAWEREEGPAQTGDVTVTAAPLAELTPDVDAYYEPRLGFGIPLIPSGQDSSGVPTNFSTSIAEYKNYLAYEMRALPDSSLRWGLRSYEKPIAYHEGALYIALPASGGAYPGQGAGGLLCYGKDAGGRSVVRSVRRRPCPAYLEL